MSKLTFDFIKLSDYSHELQKGGKRDPSIIDLGFLNLNEQISGIHKGDLILLESHPGIGTTTFCINLAINSAKLGYKIGYFSLERNIAEITKRFETCLLNNNTEIIDKNVDKNTPNKIKDLDIYISEEQNWSDFNICVSINELSRLYEIDVFILDYVQLINPFIEEMTNGDDNIRFFIQAFKHLIRELNTSLIVISKLKNDSTNFKQIPPNIFNCNVDWATDIVLLLDRLDFYGCQRDEKGNSTENIMTINILKNKYGTEGIIKYRRDFLKQTIKEIE